MNCMKCGKEIPDSQVFCEDCLADMERHPVKPGTAVQLPEHTELHQRRQMVQKKETTPEEEISFLKKMVSGLMLTVTILLLVLCMAVTSLLQLRKNITGDNADIGKNYHTTDTTDPTSGTLPSEPKSTVPTAAAK